ncbi:autotransporter outer membrane beta-barrel domain-containing protein [Zestomonas thermotolerans]|uniref:autotransporter family protein n=1 Tax=Zestomonas thermotolerans TaxID=157784 RepID=UPI0004830A1F|nr:autotransporter outer membrane beta-barrel domain-containing protein [Pseudomonas thermotolerans]
MITGAASASGGPGNGVFISDGGTLRLASGLSATGAAATTERFSDMLIVDATRVGAGGATRILVDYDPANLGHLTEGNGIELVEVRDSSASAAGAFALGNRVASGAYEYALYHGGVAGDAEDGNWYLRSFLNVEPEESGQPVIELPNYRQEVPVDMAVPALAHRLGLAVLGTYHDRAGEDYMLSAPGNVLQGYQPPEEDEHRLWARAFTSSGKAGDNSSSLPSRHREFQKDGPRYDYDLDGIQLGLDLHRSLDEDGARNIAGAYFAASRMKADVDAIQGGRGGKVSMDGYSLGAYWTHLAPSRWYLDAVGQLTRYDNVRAKASGGETVKPDGWGFAASLEGGYPFQLDEKWSLEPQAQLVYQYVDLGGSTHDRYGRIDFKDSDALYGRLGARLARNWEKEDGREHAFWLRANLWHDFGAEADTTFSAPDGQNAVKLHTGLGGTWGQVGAGFNTQFRDNLNAFLAVDYEQSLENSRAHGVSGRIGLQYTW